MRQEVQRLLSRRTAIWRTRGRTSPSRRYEVAAFLAQQAVDLKGTWVVLKKQPAPHTHSLTELGDGLGVPGELRRHLADLTPDYTVSRYPDAANAVPYELYDDLTARTKVANTEAVIAWLRSRIPS